MGICGKISLFQFSSSDDLIMESFAGSSSGQANIQKKNIEPHLVSNQD